MTEIDLQAEIGLSYHDDDLHVVIPLVGRVTQMWCQRYEALARAKDVRAMVREKRDGPARLYLTVPAKTTGSEVVNGQVAVPAGGQLKVPTPRVDQVLFRVVPPLARASRMR